MAARASSLVGSNPFGAAFNGDDLIDSSLTPTLSISPDTLGYSTSTPIEPTIELPRTKMRSAPSAAI